MSISPSRLSFAAGSTSLDPFGYRTVDGSRTSRFGQLLDRFPKLRRFMNSSSLIVNAYPATLGLEGIAPVVDTYLHVPTFIRAFRLAETEARPVLLAAQPLVGADLILKLLAMDYALPHEILWAVGGYYFPQSLQKFITRSLASRDCEIRFLHCYGVAEVGHTCFAAMDRFDCGLPRFLRVADEVRATCTSPKSILCLALIEREVNTGDVATRIGEFWKIESSQIRLGSEVRDLLESWNECEWNRRTGYLIHLADREIQFQLRVQQASCSDCEVEHFDFWSKHGGSFQAKPKWGKVK